MANIDAKRETVREIQKWFDEASLVVFTDFRGLNVAEMKELRTKLRDVGGDYRVVKNTMTRFAIQNQELEGLLPLTDGPNALMFSAGDPVEPAKVLYDFIKVRKKLEVKGGLLEGTVVDATQVKTLSTLPSREVLVAQVLGGLQAPIYGLAYVLKANITGLVRALDAVREQKEAS